MCSADLPRCCGSGGRDSYGRDTATTALNLVLCGRDTATTATATAGWMSFLRSRSTSYRAPPRWCAAADTALGRKTTPPSPALARPRPPSPARIFHSHLGGPERCSGACKQVLSPAEYLLDIGGGRCLFSFFDSQSLGEWLFGDRVTRCHKDGFDSESSSLAVLAEPHGAASSFCKKTSCDSGWRVTAEGRLPNSGAADAAEPAGACVALKHTLRRASAAAGQPVRGVRLRRPPHRALGLDLRAGVLGPAACAVAADSPAAPSTLYPLLSPLLSLWSCCMCVHLTDTAHYPTVLTLLLVLADRRSGSRSPSR